LTVFAVYAITSNYSCII